MLHKDSVFRGLLVFRNCSNLSDLSKWLQFICFKSPSGQLCIRTNSTSFKQDRSNYYASFRINRTNFHFPELFVFQNITFLLVVNQGALCYIRFCTIKANPFERRGRNVMDLKPYGNGRQTAEFYIDANNRKDESGNHRTRLFIPI